MSCVLLFFSPSLKYCTKGIRDGEHLVDSRSWLTRVCCIGSRGGDAMPFRTGPHLGGGDSPQKRRSRSWCPHPIEVLPLLHSCLTPEFPDQFFSCPKGSWTRVLEVIQGCSEARSWRWGEGHLKSMINTPLCVKDILLLGCGCQCEGGMSLCPSWKRPGYGLSALWGYLLTSAPARSARHFNRAPCGPFCSSSDIFQLPFLKNKGTECILYSIGPVIWTVIKKRSKRIHFYQHPFSFWRCLCLEWGSGQHPDRV